MPFGLAVSLFLHVGILVMAASSILDTKPLDLAETTPITVSIITPSEITRLKQGDPDAKRLEAKAQDEPKPEISKKVAPKPKPVTAPPPAASEPPPPDPIAEKLKAEEKAAAEAKEKAAEAEAVALAKKKAADEAAAKKKKAEAKRKAALKKKREKERKRKAALKKKREAEKRRQLAKKKKKKFDADRIAALIDKSPDKRGAPKRSRNPTKPTDYDGPTAGERRGRDTVLSAREIDLLKGAISAQLRDCWRLPGGGGGIDAVVVTLQWRLRRDGTLLGEPRVKSRGNGPVFQIASEAAVRAVKQCAPFRLPKDKYEAWKDITWDFDPREML